MNITFAFSLILAITSLTVSIPKSVSDNILIQSTVSVEDVKMIKEYPNAWTVKGMVRNITNKTIKGAVKIKFVNSKGDIVHTTRAYVNDNDDFGPGIAARFSYSTKPVDFEDVVRFIVDFFEN